MKLRHALADGAGAAIGDGGGARSEGTGGGGAAAAGSGFPGSGAGRAGGAAAGGNDTRGDSTGAAAGGNETAEGGGASGATQRGGLREKVLQLLYQLQADRDDVACMHDVEDDQAYIDGADHVEEVPAPLCIKGH